MLPCQAPYGSTAAKLHPTNGLAGATRFAADGSSSTTTTTTTTTAAAAEQPAAPRRP